MGGISGSGLISGIDTQTLINQLVSIAARPRQLAQQRLIQLQSQQAAYLDINSQLSALQTAAGAFRTGALFSAKKATSTDTSVLTATATNAAQQGTYGVLVDRLVTSQQLLSRGFADLDTSAIGATSITLESALARLDRGTALSELNGGLGVARGKIQITDTDGNSATIDLSKAVTVNNVLDRINEAAGINVTARVENGAFVLEGAETVVSGAGYSTAESLGLDTSAAIGLGTFDGSDVTGTRVYGLSQDTILGSLNDGNGIDLTPTINGTDFKIVFDNGGTPEAVNIQLGQVEDTDGEIITPRATTLGDVVDRINQALADAGKTSTVAINAADPTRLSFTVGAGETLTGIFERDDTDNDGTNNDSTRADATTARDLGLAGISGGAGTYDGARIFGDMNTVMLRNLGGGDGDSVPGDGQLNFTLRDGSTFAVDVSTAGTLADMISQIEAVVGSGLSVTVNKAGTGLQFTDNTSGTPTSNLIITGSGVPGADTAELLGFSTGATGVDEDSFNGNSSQMRYLSMGMELSELNNGDGVGSGRIRLTDADGITATIDVDENMRTVRDLINAINGRDIKIKARINDTGDGILLEDLSTAGSVAMKVEDLSGSVASKLGIKGEAAGVGAENFINGSAETVLDFDGTETLNEIISAINSADGGLRVSVINNGASTRPFQLSFVASESGRAGRMTFDARGVDFGLDTLDQGEDARVFIGTGDPARALLVTSSTNTLDNVISGVNIDLNSTSSDFVELSVTGDTAKIEEQVNSLVEAFNAVVQRISVQTRFVEDTGERGALLGDNTALGLSTALYNTLNGSNLGFDGGIRTLAQVGITIGEGGKMQFDSSRFRDALTSDPEAVEELFTRRTIADRDQVLQTDDNGNPLISVTDNLAADTFDELGLIPQLEELARRYTSSIDGVLTRRNESLDTQIRSQQARINSLTEGLDRERARLEAQFVAMEQALASLQSQQSALAGLGSLG